MNRFGQYTANGDKLHQTLQLPFNPSLMIDFQGSRVTSNCGLIVFRELDERLSWGKTHQQHLADLRRENNTRFPLADLFRQSAISRPADYEDVNDAKRLSQNPALRLIGSEKI
jgi:hypothetical protein